MLVKKILIGFNDLKHTATHLLIWWDYEKNSLFPTDVTPNSHKKVWWKCEKGHSFKKNCNEMFRNTACGYCSGKVILSGYNDLVTLRPDFLEWIDNAKTNIDLTKISPWSKVKIHTKCKIGHEWETTPNKMSSGYRCPYCGGVKTLAGYNDLKHKRPEVVKMWSEKNEIKPHEISYKNKTMAWWDCPKGHSWKALISDFSNGIGCSVCAGFTVLKGYNDILVKAPNIINYWSESNGKIPSEYYFGSAKIVKFICQVSKKEYKRKIRDVVSFYPHCACKPCVSIRSKPEKDLASFISSLGFIIEVSDRSIIKPLELDIVVPEKKIAFEFNGTYWHSDEVVQANKGMSSYDFHKLKKDLAKAAEYELFFVWEDDWDTDSQAVKTAISAALCGDSMGVDIGLLTRLS